MQFIALGAISVLLNTIADLVVVFMAAPLERKLKGSAASQAAKGGFRCCMMGWAPMSRSQSVSKVCAPTGTAFRRCGPCRRRISARQLMVGAPGEEPCFISSCLM